MSGEGSFDEIAEFYSLFLGEPYAASAFPAIRGLLEALVPAGADVLDVCCGAGYLARELSGMGYRVSACDLSPAMVELARANAPPVRFWVGDVRDLGSDAEFDAVVCTYNSLNHLLTPEDLHRSFRSVGQALRPGGVFVFDLLDSDGIRANGEPYTFVDERRVWVARPSYDPPGFVRARITAVWPQADMAAGWRRADWIFELRWHPSADVLAALGAAGFAEPERLSAADLGLGGMHRGREFYRARSARS